MKWMQLLVWITQLGISVAAPLGGFILLSVWLQQRFDLGLWIVILGLVLGLIGAAEGLKNSLKAMERLAQDKKEDKPSVSFNDHE